MKHSGIPLAALPEGARRQVEALIAAQEKPQAPVSDRRVRQATKGPNKLEADFAYWLPHARPQTADIRYNAVTLTIANGVRYTPDWTGWEGERLTAWEVKGPHAFDGSLEKLKMAARSFPRIKFELAWRVRGEWRIQAILP